MCLVSVMLFGEVMEHRGGTALLGGVCLVPLPVLQPHTLSLCFFYGGEMITHISVFTAMLCLPCQEWTLCLWNHKSK